AGADRGRDAGALARGREAVEELLVGHGLARAEATGDQQNVVVGCVVEAPLGPARGPFAGLHLAGLAGHRKDLEQRLSLAVRLSDPAGSDRLDRAVHVEHRDPIEHRDRDALERWNTAHAISPRSGTFALA